MAYKQKINPRTGKFDMVSNGGGGEGGIQEVKSTDKTVSVTPTADGVNLSVNHIIERTITPLADDKKIPTSKAVLDFVETEKGKLKVLRVSNAKTTPKRFIEINPVDGTAYYKLTAMVMGASGNPDYFGLLEVSFGYGRPGSNPNFCYAHWVVFTEGDPAAQQYKTVPEIKILVSEDKKKMIVGAVCPADTYQTLELHVISEDVAYGTATYGTNSTADVIPADFLSGATEVEIEDMSLQADEEDLTSKVIGKLQLKDREATTGNMGYVILRKDKTFAEQVTKANTIYEIRYEFEVGGTEADPVVIPENCVLKFEGGILKGGYISFSTLSIRAGIEQIFDGVTFISIYNGEAYPEWFGAKGNGKVDDTDSIALCVKFSKTTILGGSYLLTDVDVPANRTIRLNGSVTSDGKGFILASQVKFIGGSISVKDGKTGLTLGREDSASYRRRVVSGVYIYGGKTEGTIGIKCVVSPGNYYNCFDNLTDINIYGCYYGIYGNIRSSIISANIEQSVIGMHLFGSLLRCEITGQSGVTTEDNEWFMIIQGGNNTVKASIYDLGVQPTWHKYPCKFIGNSNKYEGSGNPNVGRFNKGVNKPIFRNLPRLRNPKPSMEFSGVAHSFSTEWRLASIFLDKRWSSKLGSRKYASVALESDVQEGYIDYLFGNVDGYVGVNFLFYGNLYSFSKLEIYDGESLIYSADAPDGDEIGHYLVDGSRAFANLRVRCHITNSVRIVAANLYAFSGAEAVPQNRDYYYDKTNLKSLIKLVPNNTAHTQESCIVYVTGANTFSEWYAVLRCAFHGRHDSAISHPTISVLETNTDITTKVFIRDSGFYECVYAVEIPILNGGYVTKDIISNVSILESGIDYVESNFITEGDKILDVDGNEYSLIETKNIKVRHAGTTAQRPILSASDTGYQYFDTTINKPISWNGSDWVDTTEFVGKYSYGATLATIGGSEIISPNITSVKEKIEFQHKGKYLKMNYSVGTTINFENLVTSASWNCAIYECAGTDIFIISGHGGLQQLLYSFLDENKKIIFMCAGSLSLDNELIQAPKKARYIVLNSNTSAPCYKIRNVSLIEDVDLIQVGTADNNPIYKEDKGKLVVLHRNVDFKSQVDGKANIIFEIRYDYDLEGQTVNFGENCILKFVGGSISNGTIVGNNTKVEGYYNISATYSGLYFGVTPTLTTGTEIADINGTKIYAPIPGANVLFPQNGYIPVAGLNSDSVLRVHFATETYPDLCLSYFSKNFAPNLLKVGATLELDVTTDVTISGRNLQICTLGSIASHIEQLYSLPDLVPNKLYRITVTVTAVTEYEVSAFSVAIQTIE